MRINFIFIPLLLALACGDDSRPRRDTGVATDGSTSDGTTSDGESRTDAPIRPQEDSCQKMDILFVIDDSGSMGEEQGNLASNFPRFVEVLNDYRTEAGNPLDYRIGVTTTGRNIETVITFNIPGVPFPPMTISETGPNGALLMPSSCSMPRRWIESSDAEVTSTFQCVANVGTSGSSVEMPLQMTRRALTDRVADGTNAGFLREDALLAVVILTDEDDCSRPEDSIELTLDASGGATSAADQCDPMGPTIEMVDEVLSAVDAVKGDRGRWAAAVIAGPGPGTCTSAFGDAAEASRLKDFVMSGGENFVFSSICEGDLAGSLMDAIDTFDVACQNFPPLI